MKRFVLCAITVLLVLAVFSPALTPLLWHLRHGELVELYGKQVPVPRYWYAEVGIRKVDLVKPPLTICYLLFYQPPPVWSFIGPLSSEPSSLPVEEVYKSFEVNYRAHRVSSDYDVTGPVRIGNGKSNAVCMKQSRIQGKEHSMVSCLLFSATWIAEFVGETREVDNFLQVIREMVEGNSR